MQKIFNNPSELEHNSKEQYAIPDFIMMENAAISMATFILQNAPNLSPNLETNKNNCNKTNQTSCIIICGKGNNGGDGYALARHLQNRLKVFLFQIEEPASFEAKTQYKMCVQLGLPFLSADDFILFTKNNASDVIFVDCIYGTGFKGNFSPETDTIIKKLNLASGLKIACDVPSGLHNDGSCTPNAFIADYTISMGEKKLCFYSDSAKNICGKIITADLGISQSLFEKNALHIANLVEIEDISLPYRTNKSANKGTYGHTAVFAGQKSGAAILSATAAMTFGSGLTTLIKSSESNLEQFKISPELMIADKIPQKTTSIIIGPGTENLLPQENEMILSWLKTTENPAAVIDAGIFNNKNFVTNILNFSNSIPNSRFIFTPHLFEFTKMCTIIKELIPEISFTENDFSIKSLANNPETKIKVALEIQKHFPNITLVIKSANTFIAIQNEIYIIADGTQNLAKGGSGDILAGMIGALLAQNYSAKDAVITACEKHAFTSKKMGQDSYNLTPESFINSL